MLRQLSEMPPGTVGFEGIGKIEDDDFEEKVEPVLRREIATGNKLRLLYLFGPESRDVEGDAITADANFRARHAGAYARVAVVSDETGVGPATRVLSALLPGKTKRFHNSELDAAKTWLVEDMPAAPPR